jgi:hypothetical protein
MTNKTIIDMNDRAVLSGITEDSLKNIKTGCTYSNWLEQSKQHCSVPQQN